ncbi:MAG: transposase [Methyloprofundus sp.]|nr:transposase [Methyloprofundus sp.]
MLNDWKAIFQVLEQPHHPLTNNEAERVLRHWVILRGICYGTRVFAILISVIETCHKRNQSSWIYSAQVIGSQRSGLPVPTLPNIRVSK